MLACKSLIVAACLIAVVGAADHTISWGFDTSQANLEVKAGDSVTWAFDQAGNPQHTVSSGDSPVLFESGLLGVGQSFTHTFPTEGSFFYYCAPHSWMSGTITVVAADPEPTTTTVASCPKAPPKKGKCKKLCDKNGMDFDKFKIIDNCPVCKCACRERIAKRDCQSKGCTWEKRLKLFGRKCRGVCHSCP